MRAKASIEGIKKIPNLQGKGPVEVLLKRCEKEGTIDISLSHLRSKIGSPCKRIEHRSRKSSPILRNQLLSLILVSTLCICALESFFSTMLVHASRYGNNVRRSLGCRWNCNQASAFITLSARNSLHHDRSDRNLRFKIHDDRYSHIFMRSKHSSSRLMSAIPKVEPAEATFPQESNAQEFPILDHYLDNQEESAITSEKTNISLKSKPKEGGNWNPSAPLEWSSHFGGRDPSKEEALLLRAQLKPGDDGYFDVSDIKAKGTTIVRNKRDAQIVLERLLSEESAGILHACDTEVMDIDLKNVGPVGNGYVTCLSMYSGPDFDYGLGDGPGTILWVDNLDDAFGVLQEFKPFFEDEKFRTVWHNYGFDRHVMWNEGIDVKGFGGDTMHMARLQDTSRAKYGAGKGYSLEALTEDLVGRRKKPMKEIFGVARLRKDGTPGSLIDLPPVEVLQRDPKFRLQWIVYSAYDAEGTWLLRAKLEALLKEMPWVDGKNMFDYYWMHMRRFGEVLTDMERRGINVDAKEYLANVEIQAREDRAGHMKAFRQWAQTMIGVDGLAINPASSTQLCTFLFGGAQNQKTKEKTEKIRKFTVPREEIPDEAMELYRMRDEEAKKKIDPKQTQLDEFDEMKAAELKALCKQYGLKVSGKKSELQERLRGHFMASNNIEMTAGGDDFESMSENDLRDACVARQLKDTGNRDSLLKRLRDDDAFALELLSASTDRSVDGYRSISEALEAAAQSDGGALSEILKDLKEKSQAEPKKVELTITSIGMNPSKFTAGGAPSVTADVLRSLAGEPFGEQPKYGKVSSLSYSGLNAFLSFQHN